MHSGHRLRTLGLLARMSQESQTPYLLRLNLNLNSPSSSRHAHDFCLPLSNQVPAGSFDMPELPSE